MEPTFSIYYKCKRNDVEQRMTLSKNICDELWKGEIVQVTINSHLKNDIVYIIRNRHMTAEQMFSLIPERPNKNKSNGHAITIDCKRIDTAWVINEIKKKTTNVYLEFFLRHRDQKVSIGFVREIQKKHIDKVNKFLDRLRTQANREISIKNSSPGIRKRKDN